MPAIEEDRSARDVLAKFGGNGGILAELRGQFVGSLALIVGPSFVSSNDLFLAKNTIFNPAAIDSNRLDRNDFKQPVFVVIKRLERAMPLGHPFFNGRAFFQR